MIQEQVNVADQGTDLVLDLESLERLPENERNEDALCDVLSEALVALRPRHLRSVIVCASSFPEKTPRTVGGDPLRLVRLEVPVWRALVHQSKLRTVLFGDYGVVFPQEVDPEGRVIPPSKIRLSTATSHALFKGPPGAYLELCQDAYRTGDLPEAVTCWGTREIWACLRCNSAKKVGNASSLVARDTNAHIEATVRSVCADLVQAGRIDSATSVPSEPWLQELLF